MRILLTWAIPLALIAIVIMLAGCAPVDDDDFDYVCTVDRVDGTFVSHSYLIRTDYRMIKMYRFTNGKKRTFMFPTERVQCEMKGEEDSV